MNNLDIINKIDIVKEFVDNSIKKICYEQDIVVIVNYINQHAFALIYDGASSKSMEVKYYTQKSGPFAGYILDPDKSNTPLKDADGCFITSDLDILMIIGRETYDRTLLATDLGFGDIKSYEYKASNAINRLFSEQLSELVPKKSTKFGQIITHGPFNRCNRLLQKCIHFPLTIFYPCEGPKTIGHEDTRQESLDTFSRELTRIQAMGYLLEIPDSWGLVCG